MFAYGVYSCDDAVQLLPVSRMVIILRSIRPRTHLSILSQSNSVTWPHGVLLAPRFRLIREGVRSGDGAARCDPPVSAAPGCT
jgi:hypothetical protein